MLLTSSTLVILVIICPYSCPYCIPLHVTILHHQCCILVLRVCAPHHCSVTGTRHVRQGVDRGGAHCKCSLKLGWVASFAVR